MIACLVTPKNILFDSTDQSLTQSSWLNCRTLLILGLKGTLDPADGNCIASNVTAPVVIDLRGHDTNDYRSASAGHGKSMFPGESWKYANKSYQFSADIIGTVNSMDGPWGGSVSTSRNYNIQKIK